MSDLICSTDAETREAVRRALTSVGLSYDDLAAKAAMADFGSLAERLAWVTVCDLRRFAPLI